MSPDAPPLSGAFPTHVGVNRLGTPRRPLPPRLPHTRGGEPMPRLLKELGKPPSPHTWG